jgi:uroporphyrinogen decarboxylase
MMDSRQLFLDACRRHPVPRPPVWLMRQVGRYMARYQELKKRASFADLLARADLAAECSLYVLDDFDPDAIIVFSDILTVLGALGASVSYEPSLTVRADLTKLAATPNEERLAPCHEALASLAGTLKKTKALVGFAGAPFTLFHYLFGDGEEVRTTLLRDPHGSERVIDTLAKAIALHLRRQVESGADVLQIFDSHAGELSPRQYERFALPAMQNVLAELDDLECPIIVFARGRHHLENRAKLPGRVLSLDWTIPLDRIDNPAALAVQGNLDPAFLRAGPEQTCAETKIMLAQARRFGGYIANLGHGVLPRTPMESVQAFVATVKNFSLGGA